jgi:hypothetical protein
MHRGLVRTRSGRPGQEPFANGPRPGGSAAGRMLRSGTSDRCGAPVVGSHDAGELLTERARAGDGEVPWLEPLPLVGRPRAACADRGRSEAGDSIVQHVYRQTRKLSRIAIICHSESALDIHHDGCATLSHGQMTPDDRERRCRPAAGTAAADASRQSRSEPMSERDNLEETPR